MCGLGGIFQYSPAGPAVERATLERMGEATRHRGPDAFGLWMAPDRRLGLVHNRLSIVDLAAAAAQPMANEAGTVTVVFNGEIYNHRALRRELEAAGQRFRTDHADTEVIVKGFEAWGWDAMLERLRGMFVIALWDANASVLHLARDRVGIKPVYVWQGGGRLVFASEIKAILRVPGVPREIDPHAMYHYLGGMAAPAPMTLFAGIQKLPPGTSVTIARDGKASVRRYWRMPEAAGPGAATPEEAAQGVREILYDALDEHCMADVPIGVFLSGGVDSGALLARLSSVVPGRVRTFSVGYEGFPALDERDRAREMAERFGAEHREVVVGLDTLEASWEEILYHQDEPLADWVCFPLWHVAKLAAGDVKVVLVGEGADEQFAGYDGYLHYLDIERRYWDPYRRLVPRPLRTLAAGIARGAMRWWPDLAGVADAFDRAARDRELFWGGAITFWETQKSLLLDRDALPRQGPTDLLLDDSAWREYDSFALVRAADSVSRAAPGDSLARMINREFEYRLPELLLMRVDKMTMAHSLEARVPFLDHRLVAASYALPSAWKTAGGVPKAILKRAVRGLVPDEVIDRPKVGFGAPVAQWLKGEFGERVERGILESTLFAKGWFRPAYVRHLFRAHREGRRDYATNLWALHNLCAWHDRWVEPGAFAGR
ncbi:MAG: asparagine synthase (glutamine-hydrolyzing) [Betaproteobacteria bacterium]|nr:asparagine synthase (glutamine-hydrolyzing) [Betaproteobacteria bacterium]